MFILRHPAQEVQFLKFTSSPGVTVTAAAPKEAGRLVYLVDDRTVDVIGTASSQRPVGWLMQKVKAAYTDFPQGFMMRGDHGSSDAFVGDPVGIACGHGAIYETDMYVDEDSDGIAAGVLLYPDDDGKLSDTDADSCLNTVAAAIALNTLTAAQCTAGELLLIQALI